MLRIDLLPKTFARARTNKMLLVIVLVLLGIAALYWLRMSAALQRQINEVQQKIAEVKPKADEFDRLSAELASKRGELAPIAAKVEFVKQADDSGKPYWEAYHKLKRYIYERARVLEFSIQPPNQVTFTAVVHGTSEYARFLINLLHCPHMTLTGFAALSGGRGVPSAKAPEPGQWPTAAGKRAAAGIETPPGAAGRAGGGVGGPGPMGPMMGAGPMGGPPEMPMGAPPGGPGPAGPPGPEGMMGPGMMGPGPMGPGMMGMAGGAGAGAATTEPEKQEITIQVRGTLAESITVPAPPGGGAAGMAGGAPGMGMGPMMGPGPEMGMPGGGGMPPGGPPGGPAGGPGGPPAGGGGPPAGGEEGGLGGRRGGAEAGEGV
ncbi:MAG: hypothetical protein H5T86_11580 [Armatimonadetes bacterium]|nr:hypothetical protein [Armatimonadota bacterium]